MLFIDIIKILWLLLPAAFANMAPVMFKFVPFLNYPVDLGARFNGKHLFGENKTYRGFVFGILTAIVIVWVQKIVTPYMFASYPIDYGAINICVFGALLGFSALFGDLVKSFFKRRKNIAPGSNWFPYDQIDWIIGALIVVNVYNRISLATNLLVIIIYGFMHILVNYARGLAKVKLFGKAVKERVEEINFKKLRFYTLLVLAVVSIVLTLFPFFGGYSTDYYKTLLESYGIPQLIYLGWVILATSTALPFSAAMIAGIVYFSFGEAMFYTCIGILVGAIATYYVAKLLGKDFVTEDYKMKGKTKLHILNELIHKHSIAYVVLLAWVYIFPSNLAFMIAAITEVSFLKMLVITVIGNVGTAFAVGGIIWGILHTNLWYIILGAVFLGLVNGIPIILYYKQMKKLVILAYSEKAYRRLERIEKIVEKDVAIAEKAIVGAEKKIEKKIHR